jgi:hypothetical protein
MTNLVIRYQTKPEATRRNAELIRNVFREAAAAAPEGGESRRSAPFERKEVTVVGNYCMLPD